MAGYGYNTGLDGHRARALTEAEAEEIAESISTIYEMAKDDMLVSMADRMSEDQFKRYGQSVNAWRARKLNEVGTAHARLADAFDRSREDRNRALSDVINRAMLTGSQKFYREMGAILGDVAHISPNSYKAAYILADLTSAFDTAERRILRQHDDVYADMIGVISSELSTGVMTYQEAVGRALTEFADRGVSGFIDRAGRHWQMADYAEMAVLTAIERATVSGYVDTMQSYGYDLAYIDGHVGSCPICEAWEGVIISVSGHNPDYPSLADAENAGCFHPRCMHGISTYYEGISHPPPGGFRDEPREVEPASKQYSARSRQRYAERMTRKYRDRALVAQTEQQKRQAMNKVREWKNMLDSLIEQQPVDNDLYRHSGREGVLPNVTGAKKTRGWESRHAKRYYEEVRKRAPYVDARKIAEHTGLTVKQVESIRHHVFIDEHLIDGVMRRFDEDYYQSVAWQRLVDGKGTDEDLVFLKHELRELTLEHEMGYNHDEAHEAANVNYDWWSMVQRRLGEK